MARKAKPYKPDWRCLRIRMRAVEVLSCSDGTLRIQPKWADGYAFGEKHIPGLFTRMGVAGELQKIINHYLRGSKRAASSAEPAK